MQLGLEIRCVHHQRIALPVPDGVSGPVANRSRKVRTAVQGNDPKFVNVFREQNDLIPRLNDLIVTMQTRAVHSVHARHTIGDATISGRDLIWSGGISVPGSGATIGSPAAPS